VIDPRTAFLTAERLPDADELVARWPDDALPALRLGPRDAAVCLSHDAKFDEPTLDCLLRSPVGYIGAIGSRTTHGKRVARLRDSGFTDADIARVHSPVGLDLGSRTPEEIALAIMAEIVAVRRGRRGGLLAAAAPGEGVTVGRPVESQVRLSAAHRGLLRVDAPVLDAMNALGDVTVFALPDGIPIDAGRAIAGVKITPLAIPETELAVAEERAAAGAHAGRVMTVRRFLPLTVTAVVCERLDASARARFESSLRGKLAWFGGRAGDVLYAAGDPAATRDALLEAAVGSDIVLAVGVA